MALGLALLATIAVVLGTTWLRAPDGAVGACPGCGKPAPAIAGTTLDGAPFDLASLRGRPVVVNFWGPSCVPCRDEFPLLKAKLQEHATDGLAVVGVLMDDPAAPARDFATAYGATWPTVQDPGGTIKAAYRAVARPQSYFIDGEGILRRVQVGQIPDSLFESLYSTIAPSPGASSVPASGAP